MEFTYCLRNWANTEFNEKNLIMNTATPVAEGNFVLSSPFSEVVCIQEISF